MLSTARFDCASVTVVIVPSPAAPISNGIVEMHGCNRADPSDADKLKSKDPTTEPATAACACDRLCSSCPAPVASGYSMLAPALEGARAAPDTWTPALAQYLGRTEASILRVAEF